MCVFMQSDKTNVGLIFPVAENYGAGLKALENVAPTFLTRLVDTCNDMPTAIACGVWNESATYGKAKKGVARGERTK